MILIQVSFKKSNKEFPITLFDYDNVDGVIKVELVSVVEMKRGAGNHYTYVVDGKGKGIIEDMCPGMLLILLIIQIMS